MAKTRSLGELVQGLGKLLDTVTTSRQPGPRAGEDLDGEPPSHDFLDRAWGFEREPPSQS